MSMATESDNIREGRQPTELEGRTEESWQRVPPVARSMSSWVSNPIWEYCLLNEKGWEPLLFTWRRAIQFPFKGPEFFLVFLGGGFVCFCFATTPINVDYRTPHFLHFAQSFAVDIELGKVNKNAFSHKNLHNPMAENLWNWSLDSFSTVHMISSIFVLVSLQELNA